MADEASIRAYARASILDNHENLLGERDTGEWVSLGDVARPIVSRLRDDVRFRYLIETVHALGPRPLGEMLSEIGSAHKLNDKIVSALEVYAALPADFVRVNGGDKWHHSFASVPEPTGCEDD